MPKILVIDDKKDNLLSISAMLRALIPDCNVITALSGAEGLKKAKQELPDTVLLDIIMPGMDGYEVCEKLKSDDTTKHIPVIMLTAIKTDSESRIKGLKTGAEAFFSKPIDAAELSAQVNVMLRIKQAEDKLRRDKENLEQIVAERTKDVRESEQKYSSVVLNSKDTIIIYVNGIIKFVNPAATELSGYSAEELIGKNVIELVVPEQRKLVAQRFSERTDGKEVINIYEINIIKKDSSLLPIEINATAMKYEGENAVLVFIRDISERKRTEKSLIESKRKLQSIFRAAPTGIGLVTDRVLLEVNQKICEMTGYDYDELIGKNAMVLYPTKEDYDYVGKVKYDQIIEKGTGTVETRWKKKDGKIIDILLSSTPLDTNDLKKGFTFTALDITERKQAEEKLKKSLQEKEILLKEIQHRVKNNLAVVSGLLNLQSTYIKDKDAIAAFQESKKRIYSMSAVHSQLSYSEDYSTIDYKEYIKNLVTNIFYSSQKSDHVKLHFDLDDITLPIDKAIPCGLLLNEIVTNALKHAFPENRKGNLRIVMSSLEDKNCEIIVKDDGVGIPEDFNIEDTKSLGLKLINLMIKQIDGTIEIISDKGAEFRIRLSTEPGQVIR